MKRRPFWGALLHRAQVALWRACRVLQPDAHPGQGPSWRTLPARRLQPFPERQTGHGPSTADLGVNFRGAAHRPSETLFGILECHVKLAGRQGERFKLQALLGTCALLKEGNPVDVGGGQHASDLSCIVCVHDGLRQGGPS